MDRTEVAEAILKIAKSITSGCEKLPEGAMRDNCEKKKDEGKDKKEAVAKQLLKIARELTVGRDVVTIAKTLNRHGDYYIVEQLDGKYQCGVVRGVTFGNTYNSVPDCMKRIAKHHYSALTNYGRDYKPTVWYMKEEVVKSEPTSITKEFRKHNWDKYKETPDTLD